MITNANKESKSSVSFFYVILLRISIVSYFSKRWLTLILNRFVIERKIVKYKFIKVFGSFLTVKENALDCFAFIKQIKVNWFRFFFRSENILFLYHTL